MNKKIIFTILLGTLLILKCVPHQASNEEKAAKIMHKIEDEFTLETQKNNGYVLFAKNSYSQFPAKISLALRAFKVCDIEFARKTFLEHHQNFIDKINQNKSIRPYLPKYPISNKDVDLAIYFEHEDNSGTVCGVYQIGPNIVYTHRLTDARPVNQNLYKEPYEEALAIVQE